MVTALNTWLLCYNCSQSDSSWWPLLHVITLSIPIAHLPVHLFLSNKGKMTPKYTYSNKSLWFCVSQSACVMRRLIIWSSCCRVRLSVLLPSWPPSHRKSLLFPVTASSFKIECLVSKDNHFYFLVLCNESLTFFLPKEVTAEPKVAFISHKETFFLHFEPNFTWFTRSTWIIDTWWNEKIILSTWNEHRVFFVFDASAHYITSSHFSKHNISF